MHIASILYILAAICSFLMLVVYIALIRKKYTWVLVLFTSICVVNVGYFALSISKTLSEALLANRIAYLGSVFLPISMLLIIINSTNLKCPKWLWVPLFGLGVAVFFVAASPGYSDIYYKNVVLITVDGVSVLDKEYGAWHIIYPIYLIGYFTVMITAVIYAAIKKKNASSIQSIMLLSSVLVNICVWSLEQFMDLKFEFLAISYIITELFLIGVCIIIQETEKRIQLVKEQFSSQQSVKKDVADEFPQQVIDIFKQGINELTQTEKLIFDLYIAGKNTKEILEKMNIKENTLKYHNKNIYSKLGVSSRKELKAISNSIK